MAAAMKYRGPALINMAEIFEIQRFWATLINAHADTTTEGECR